MVRRLRDLVEVIVPFMDEHLPCVLQARPVRASGGRALLDYWEHGARRRRPCTVAGCEVSSEPRASAGTTTTRLSPVTLGTPSGGTVPTVGNDLSGGTGHQPRRGLGDGHRDDQPRLGIVRAQPRSCRPPRPPSPPRSSSAPRARRCTRSRRSGTTMYVGGRFAQLRDSSGQTTYDRANFAAFNAKTGEHAPAHAPDERAGAGHRPGTGRQGHLHRRRPTPRSAASPRGASSAST